MNASSHLNLHRIMIRKHSRGTWSRIGWLSLHAYYTILYIHIYHTMITMMITIIPVWGGIGWLSLIIITMMIASIITIMIMIMIMVMMVMMVMMMVMMITILVLRFIIILNSASFQDDQHQKRPLMINIIASQSCWCWQNWFFHLRSAQPWYYRGCRVCKMENFPKKHPIGNDSVYKSNGNDTEKVRYLTPVLTPPLPTAAFTHSSLTTYSSFSV